MSDYLSSRLEADPRITIRYQTEVETLHGEDTLDAVTVRDNGACESHRIDSRAVFVMVGAAPNTKWLADLAELDAKASLSRAAMPAASLRLQHRARAYSLSATFVQDR